MSSYEEYAEEKQLLDGLVEEGRRIVEIKEDLDGAVVLFSALPESSERKEAGSISLRLSTADARKHVAVLLIRQQAVPQEL
ncbi:hypothetical protein SAMN05444162_4594 [Paenibacillaceae bacterium GAS479]|nr:hypothetical protein SAMN05444162_4594 [Paenibacillaceae bacterium GAS479]